MIDMLSASDSSPYCTARAAAATAGESGDYGGRATESYKTAAIFSDCAPQLCRLRPADTCLDSRVDVYTPSTVRAYAKHIRRVYPMVGHMRGATSNGRTCRTPRTG
jgi:hypothetical protein